MTYHQRIPAAAPASRPRLHTIDEVADLLRVSAWTVHRLIREERLGSVKIGARRLIPAEDLTRYIAEQHTGHVRQGAL